MPPPDNERLARIEALVEKNHETTVMMRGELKDHMAKEDKKAEEIDKRVDGLEQRQTKTETHLNWMKGIWIAVQGTVIGWFGMK